jgi:hypothetical protein
VTLHLDPGVVRVQTLSRRAQPGGRRAQTGDWSAQTGDRRARTGAACARPWAAGAQVGYRGPQPWSTASLPLCLPQTGLGTTRASAEHDVVRPGRAHHVDRLAVQQTRACCARRCVWPARSAWKGGLVASGRRISDAAGCVSRALALVLQRGAGTTAGFLCAVMTSALPERVVRGGDRDGRRYRLRVAAWGVGWGRCAGGKVGLGRQ